MDRNLVKLGINQKKEKRIKDTTTQINMNSLLRILKAYYVNTHHSRLV